MAFLQKYRSFIFLTRTVVQYCPETFQLKDILGMKHLCFGGWCQKYKFFVHIHACCFELLFYNKISNLGHIQDERYKLMEWIIYKKNIVWSRWLKRWEFGSAKMFKYSAAQSTTLTLKFMFKNSFPLGEEIISSHIDICFKSLWKRTFW